jgi:hypothetical protein
MLGSLARCESAWGRDEATNTTARNDTHLANRPGVLCYVVTWLGYSTFYSRFNVTPETVGISYPALVIPTAVFTVLMGILLIGIAALAAPVFMPISVRAARILAPLGFILFTAYVVSFTISGEARREQAANTTRHFPSTLLCWSHRVIRLPTRRNCSRCYRV